VTIRKFSRKLDLEQPLTSEAILAAIAATKENSKTRKRACMALGALAKFAGLEVDLKPLAGRYGPQSVQPRDLPDDALIAEWFDRISNPAWQWVYGIMATYGLRNHEVFHLDFERLRQGDRVIAVGENTKTGSRRVWACYPEWFDAFDLAKRSIAEYRLESSNEKIGNSVTDSLRERGLPFPPYALRHCWAVRTIEFGLDTALAAKQMGHSEQIHTITYHHWIGDRHHQRAYDALMMRSDRPLPPV
jgi:integrase